MSTIETTTTSLQPPEPDYATDEAQLAAAAFLARYSGRTLDAYRHDLHPGSTDAVAAPLVPLRAAILPADNPTQVRNWLRHSSAGQLLGRLVSGEPACRWRKAQTTPAAPSATSPRSSTTWPPVA